MGHNVMVNATGKTIEHPVTGQLIPPGHTYTMPTDDELKAQDKAQKAWEKTRAKEAADAAARVKEEADKKATEEAGEAARLDAERKAHEELLAKQAAATAGDAK